NVTRRYAIGEAGTRDALARVSGLRVRQRERGDAITRATREFGEAAPAAADLQDAGSDWKRELGQDPFVLCVLRDGERARELTLEQRRRVGHRRIQPQRVETIAEVVVRDDGAFRLPR